MKKISIIIFIGLLVFAFSCKKPVSLPPVPAIVLDTFMELDSLDGLGNKVVWNIVKFKLTDGDGDMGNDAPDTLNDYSNTFITMYKKENGIFYEYIPKNSFNDTIPLNVRIPKLPVSGGIDKSLKATVTVNIEGINLRFLPVDTFKYELYVKDRAGHKSNILETPETVGLGEVILLK